MNYEFRILIRKLCPPTRRTIFRQVPKQKSAEFPNKNTTYYLTAGCIIVYQHVFFEKNLSKYGFENLKYDKEFVYLQIDYLTYDNSN